MKLNYRKDIDGLRAIAVISVILFHSGFEIFSGGFVGVDIFFVISGFLITKIIYKEIEAGEFSIARFYERRIRRIFPALFAVIVFCFVIGFMFYGPDEYMRVAKSIRYTIVFFSNYLFARKTGYFDTSSEFEPLLHTWSLAVEEQYYIVFPAILYAVAKYLKQQYIIVLSIIFIFSLVLSVLSVEANQHRAFFSTEVRTWELILGSLIAINAFPRIHNIQIKNILSLTGLCFILISVFLYDGETVFPGYSALLPTIGSGLIIYSGLQGSNDYLVGRLLSIKPVVFIGLISYSLYMWHWPLLVITKHLLIRPLDTNEIFLMLAVIGLVSYLSWKYIEQPFRSDNLIKGRKKLFRITIMIMCFFFILCLIIKATDGLSTSRGHQEDVIWEKWSECSKETAASSFGGRSCLLGDSRKSPSFMLWSDSHGKALAHGLDLSASKFEVSGKIASANGCSPIMDVRNLLNEECYEVNHSVFNYISDHPELKTIVLIGRWAREIDGNSYGVERKEKVVLVDALANNEKNTNESNELVVTIGLKRTVQRLLELNRQVVLVSQVPAVGYNVPSVDFVATKMDKDINAIISPSILDYKKRNAPVVKLFNQLKGKGVKIIEPWQLLCDDTKCRVKNDIGLLYRDDDHLSSIGSKVVSPMFDEIFR